MRKLSIEQVKVHLSKEIKDLPFEITIRGKVIARTIAIDDASTTPVEDSLPENEPLNHSGSTFKPQDSDIKWSKPSSTIKRREKTPKICSCGGMIIGMVCQKCKKSYL